LFSHPIPLSGEFGHTPVAGNRRRCGCGALGCLETLVSERGLLESFSALTDRPARSGSRASWKLFSSHVNRCGLDPWLKETLEATARVVAGALNVLGVRRLVITGRLTELPACIAHLSDEIRKGSMWGRFGEISCQAAPHRRAAGLVAAGIDRLILPTEEDAAVIPVPVSTALAP
jgi:predicted NBD/HSP70 family sugar kinase